MNNDLYIVVEYDLSILSVSSDPSVNELYQMEPSTLVPDSDIYSTIGASGREHAKAVYPKPRRLSTIPLGEDLDLL